MSDFLESGREQGLIFLPVCPEQLGGLPTPRLPSEIVSEVAGQCAPDLAGRCVPDLVASVSVPCAGKVINEQGMDVTHCFVKGAEEVLCLVRQVQVSLAVLKDGSPSCGTTRIHAGRFDGETIPGQGVCARALQQEGVQTINEKALLSLWREYRSVELILKGTKHI